MFVVVADSLDDLGIVERPAATLEQAFAIIACLCGYTYAFEHGQHGWSLIMTDVENPAHSPDPIVATLLKSDAAKRELLRQAVDGRLKGYAAVLAADLRQRRELAESEAVSHV